MYAILVKKGLDMPAIPVTTGSIYACNRMIRFVPDEGTDWRKNLPAMTQFFNVFKLSRSIGLESDL